MAREVDRPAAIRQALRDLVAERGFHGASMSAVATAAGVATGTAYVHYESKADRVLATYLEIKQQLGDAVVAEIDPKAGVEARYRQMWLATYRYLIAQPERARFLSQLEESPYYESAHRKLEERGDKLLEVAASGDFAAVLLPLPIEVVYLLTIGVAVRLVAAGIKLSDEDLESVVTSTFRAVTR